LTIKLYWWRGDGSEDSSRRNFGDYLSPLIVEMVSGQSVKYAPLKSADMMAIGSILYRERRAKRFLFRRRLHIWGTGTDSFLRRFSGRHYYHAVRGVKTRNQIESFHGTLAFGDPGILSGDWWSGRPKPLIKYRLGLVPHFVDHKDPRVKAILNLPGVKMINVFDPVETVLKEIQQCRFILSSSLHGLIVADSFGIPNRRIVFSRGIISDFKFLDYYTAFGMDVPDPLEPESLIKGGGVHFAFEEAYTRAGLEDIKRGLIDSFPIGL
jgi:pyruvyltransferase